MKKIDEWKCSCGRVHNISDSTVSLTCVICGDTYNAPAGKFPPKGIGLCSVLTNRVGGKHPRDLFYTEDGMQTQEQAMNKAIAKGDVDKYREYKGIVNKARLYRGQKPLD